MANIPGIVGYVGPGAFSLVEVRPGPVSLPGGPTVIAILGQGRREEVLIARAAGNGADGSPVGFSPANSPDGRHFQLSCFPVVAGTVEVFINPTGSPSDLPLIQILSQDMADAWVNEFGDTTATSDPTATSLNIGVDGYDSLDGQQGESDGTGFFNTQWGRQFEQLKERLGITAGSPEPNHYVFDKVTGRIVLDQPLAPNDTLVVSYLCTKDLNSPEMMFNLKSVVAKHGYPSFFNTISLAAQVAFENGAGVVMPVHAGQVVDTYGRLQAEPTMATALAALEREETVEILVPITHSRIYNEVVVASFDSTDASLTSAGKFLQRDSISGAPGLNITPLALIPSGTEAGNPVLLNLYKNGRLLQYGVDYSVTNLDGSDAGPVDGNQRSAALIALDPTYAGASHTVDQTLELGDRITADYLPDPSVSNLVATAQLSTLLHCQLMSQTRNRRERTCLLGAYEFVDLDFILDPVTGIATNFGQYHRSMFFYPGGYEITRVVGGASLTLDAQYIAAAAAGLVAASPVQETLTFKNLQGFTIPSTQKLTVDETNLIGGAGVAIVTPLASGGRVLHGLTTANDGLAVHEEYSVVRISDFVAKTVRVALENAFVGKLITLNTPNDVKITTTSILGALVSQGIVNSFSGVDAFVDPQEPRQIDVRFNISPVFPLNWIFINFTIGA